MKLTLMILLCSVVAFGQAAPATGSRVSSPTLARVATRWPGWPSLPATRTRPDVASVGRGKNGLGSYISANAWYSIMASSNRKFEAG